MFVALYQGNTGVSGITQNNPAATAAAAGMLHMNMGMNVMVQQPTQQAPAAGNTICTVYCLYCAVLLL